MKQHDADRLIGVLADLQHGLITRQQARESGLTDAQIARRVAQGRWIKCEPHMFRIVGVPVTWQQRVLSACLATDGVASHRTAAMLLGLGLWPAGIVEVTTDPDRNYRNPDVHVHRSVDDPTEDSSTYEGIPVTAVRRTLVDLGAVVPRDRSRSVSNGRFFGADFAPDPVGVHRRDRPAGTARRATLRAVLELRGRVAGDRERPRDRDGAALRRAGLPAPRDNSRSSWRTPISPRPRVSGPEDRNRDRR